jgi:hypothetical protein
MQVLMQRVAKKVLISACVVLLALPAGAFGVIALRNKREADAFYTWRSDASAALTQLTNPKTSRSTPKVRGSQCARLTLLAQQHGVALVSQGDILRVPHGVFVQLEGQALLAIVPGPTVDGSDTCMALNAKGEVSFVMEASVLDALRTAVRW